MNWEKYAQYSMINLSLQRFINHELNIRGPKVFITDVLCLSPKKLKKKKPRLAYKIYNHFENRNNVNGGLGNNFYNSVRIACANWNTEFEDDVFFPIPPILQQPDNAQKWIDALRNIVTATMTKDGLTVKDIVPDSKEELNHKDTE